MYFIQPEQINALSLNLTRPMYFNTSFCNTCNTLHEHRPLEQNSIKFTAYNLGVSHKEPKKRNQKGKGKITGIIAHI